MNDCLQPLYDEVELLTLKLSKHNGKIECKSLSFRKRVLQKRIALVKSQIHELKAIFNEYDRN